jgi:phosphate transport system substrate-binding protein
MRGPRLVVTAVALMSLTAGAVAAAPASATTHAQISGSGSSWASSAVNQWIADLFVDGLQVVYTASGSAQGKLDFANKATDFAVTDVPYLGKDPVTGTVDSSEGRAYGDVPFVAGATTFPYHIRVAGKLVTNLRLSGETIAKIFTNRITNWDSPEITADNNGHALPSLPIIPVVHSEGSGASYEFTTYLADEHPHIWKAFAGNSKPTQYYPRQGNQIAENGSDGVMNYVSSSSADGAIGVDEYAYALAKNYPVANLENRAGYYVAPTEYGVAIALRNATIDETPTDPDYMRPDLNPVYDSTDRRAYPLSSYSSMLIPTSATDPRMTTAKRQTVAEFGYYGLCQGQAEVGPIGDAPLPLNLVKAGLIQIRRLHVADPAVDVASDTVGNCHNPTFVASKPGENYLGRIAPEPPACDRSGKGPCHSGATAAAASSMTIRASSDKIVAGGSVTIRGRLTSAKQPIGGAKVKFEQRILSQPWKTLRLMTTSLSGGLSATLPPIANAEYRFRFAGDAAHAKSTSAIKRVDVALDLKAKIHHSKVASGGRAVIVGEVFPKRPYTMRLQQFFRHHWHNFYVNHHETPTFRIILDTGQRGTFRYRIRVGPTRRNAATTSPVLKLTVH